MKGEPFGHSQFTLNCSIDRVNRIFVATEFAIVKIRSSRIDQLVEEGSRGAKAAQHVITHMDEYLSAVSWDYDYGTWNGVAR